MLSMLCAQESCDYRYSSSSAPQYFTRKPPRVWSWVEAVNLCLAYLKNRLPTEAAAVLGGYTLFGAIV